MSRSVVVVLVLAGCSLPEIAYLCHDKNDCQDGFDCVQSGERSVCVKASGAGGGASGGGEGGGAVVGGGAGGGAGAAGGGSSDAGLTCQVCPPAGFCGRNFDAGAGCPTPDCACEVGLECRDKVCQLPRVCTGEWCYEFPKPQGGHLYAASATSNSFLWGGERGMVFEWDGFETKHTPLTRTGGGSVTDDVIFLGGSPQAGWVLATSSGAAWIRSRANMDWAVLAEAPQALACRPAVADATGLYLGCRSQPDGGGAVVLAHTPTSAVPLPSPVPLDRIDALTVASGVVVAVGPSDAGSITLVRSAAGSWLSLDASVPDGGSLSQFFGSSGAVTFVHPVGGLQLLGRRDRVGLIATLNANGWKTEETAFEVFGGTVDADGIWVSGRNGVFRVGLNGARELYTVDSLHDRAWFASAAAGDRVLAVGAFGATALMRRSDLRDAGSGVLTSVGRLMSSAIGLNTTDLCGPADGGAPFITTSAASAGLGTTLVARADDFVHLNAPTNGFGGVLSRTDAGEWAVVPLFPNATNWTPAVDQCFVDDTGNLHVVTTPYLHDFFAQPRVTPVPRCLATFQRFTNLWSEGTSSLVGDPNCPLFVVGASDAGYVPSVQLSIAASPYATTTARQLNACVPYGRDPRVCVSNRVWEPVAQGSFDAGEWLASDPTLFGYNLHGRGNSVWTARTNVDVTTIAKRQPDAGCESTGCVRGFSPTWVSGPGQQREVWRAQRIWVDADQTPFLLSSWQTTRATYEDLFEPSVTFRVSKHTSDGGLDALGLPVWVWSSRSYGQGPLNLWGTQDRLYVQWSRGVVSRVKP